jgi:hypothetical protein|tara:strand:- start:1556 stop:3433 length:1878 start_codon:yes stop_codon:yes gene_type:complete
MSWHKEFLSTNKGNKSTVSTFEDLYSLIAEVYEVEKDRLFKSTKDPISLLKEQFLNEKQGVSFNLQAIPEIAVSELGWTNITGEGDTQVSGPERKKLEQFLENIGGNNFVEKIGSLSRFYDDPDAALQSMFPEGSNSMPKQIATALSYLVFFKTLTKVISNFNAASAGFNFEAFLAVLTKGEQVKANTGTIADFISRADGTNMPISLKLYQEGKLHVGGSFTDLANDLVEQKPEFDYPFMRYLAVTKEFEGGQREGLDINGILRWFQFDFTLENVFDILAQSSTKSQKCIQLPIKFLSGETPDFAATLPGTAIPSPEKLEQVFVAAFEKELNAHNVLNSKVPSVQVDADTASQILKNLNWSDNDDIFLFYDPNPKEKDRPDDYELQPLYISRGDSRMPGSNSKKFKEIMAIVASSLEQVGKYDMEDPTINNPSTRKNSLVLNITRAIVNANNGGKKTEAAEDSVISMYSRSKLKDERLQFLKGEGVFASIEESRAWWGAPERTEEERKAAIKQTYGYLTTEQFNLNQAVVEKVDQLSDKRVLPEGQSAPGFGTIYVGANNTQAMLNKMTGLINDAIFGIFLSVKNVQESTYAYMAGGLQDESQADNAIAASNDIIAKTSDLKPAK